MDWRLEAALLLLKGLVFLLAIAAAIYVAVSPGDTLYSWVRLMTGQALASLSPLQ